jgi:hypothetical protein
MVDDNSNSNTTTKSILKNKRKHQNSSDANISGTGDSPPHKQQQPNMDIIDEAEFTNCLAAMNAEDRPIISMMALPSNLWLVWFPRLHLNTSS